MSKIAIRRALISVYDKSGLDDLARGLSEAGVEIVSTGSTAARIRELGIPVQSVDEMTGFAEILEGRVKTLHPHVHAGLLADQNDPEHMATIERLGIAPFQLLVSNLYPFVETVRSGATPAEIVEQIDVGGPAMVRASAKNHGSVAVVVDPRFYPDVLQAVRDGGFDLAARQRLAVAAFRHTADYDIAVASYLGNVVAPDDAGSGFPGWVAGSWERAAALRYGENPHQRAALYVAHGGPPGLASAEQLSGKEMSYNNYVDADAARRAVFDFAEPCVAIVKHANPCGIAIATDAADAYRNAQAGDPVSAYGGVVAANVAVSAEMARQVAEIFTEVILAPSYDEDASRSCPPANLRVLLAAAPPPHPTAESRPVSGGLLIQTSDRLDAAGDNPGNWNLAAGAAADDATLGDLVFAWRAVRSVKSNAILIARTRATVGIGMGQVNRVDAARLAVARAGERALGAVASSDAYFPFPDVLEVLVDAGVRAVVQPGGSVRDADCIAVALAAGVTLYLTGTRHFAH
jgi:phosphoribosylaminoimidazolecarboxamide formyltransferase/IMP cyclohydrolase